jgi:hypothetical protein
MPTDEAKTAWLAILTENLAGFWRETYPKLKQ